MRASKSLAFIFILPGFLGLAAWAADPSIQFRRGDANGDGKLDLSDAIKTLGNLFLDGGAFDCAKASDSNGDGLVDLSDVIFSLEYLFQGGTEPPAPGLICGADPSADALDCQSYPACARPSGRSDFVSPLLGNPRAAGAPAAGADAAGFGAPGAADAGATPQGAAPAPDRLIEESDIYKLEGNLLLVLNRYRGLQVIDLTDLDHPRMIGRAPIYGYPKEMYVRDERAYVIVSDYFSFWRDPASSSDVVPDAFYGSQVRIVDISDPTHPQVTGGIDLAGDASDSRIVGEVMYVVSQRYSWMYQLASSDTVDQTEVVSVSIADPTDVHLVDRKEFPRNGWDHHLAVTPESIYLASSGYEAGDWTQLRTHLQVIDITDPEGTIVVRGSTALNGMVQDRWAMDEYQGVLRVASSQSWGNGDVVLSTFDVSDPDHVAPLGKYTLSIGEHLTAARFDGPRGYLVSYRAIDPLYAFDLSDPVHPALLGELKMTGWLDFMVPLGDRIVALGHEDITDPQTGARKISLAVSLIDSSGAGAPSLLSRVTLDGVWGWVPSSRDDYAKVFRTLPGQGLILFPFQAWSDTTYSYVGGVQLIDLQRDKLVKRGLIGDTGWWVERGIPDGDTTVLTLSSEIFQVVDIADRDHPRLRGKLELARNVTDFALLPGEEALQLSSDWSRGDTQLSVTPSLDPDTPSPLAQVSVDAPYGRLFVNGSLAYVASTRTIPGDVNYTQETRVQVFDLADPAHPVERGSVTLPEEVWIGGGWFWGWGDEVIQVRGSVLAFHRSMSFWWYMGGGPVAVDAAAADAAGIVNPGGTDDQVQKIFLVDLADPDHPQLASTVKLDGVDWAWGLKASGNLLYLSTYSAEIVDNQWVARYFLNRIDVTDPASPAVLPGINIPGMFVDASPSGSIIYTSETTWEPTTYAVHNLFHALEVFEDKAYLQSSVELPGYSYGIQVKDGAAFAVTYWWENIVGPVGVAQSVNHTELVTIDLGDPKAIRIAGEVKVPFDYAYLQKVDGGRAFLGSWAGIFVYDVGDIAQPAFEEFFRTQGWSQDIVVRGDRAWVPSGYYGVQVLELGTGQKP